MSTQPPHVERCDRRTSRDSSLPPGWESLGDGEPGVLVQLTFDTKIDGANT